MSGGNNGEIASFAAWDLDKRLHDAVLMVPNVTSPTPVQRQVIPVALQGRHILTCAPTGSGKTLAYLIPMIQRILSLAGSDESPALQGLVLVPSLDLCAQIHNVLKMLLKNCSDIITADRLEPKKFDSVKLPTILISTPTTLLDFIKKRDIGEKFKQQLKFVVLDEADSLVAFEQDAVMQELASSYFPDTSSHAYQAILCSATLDVFVSSLQGLMLHRPEILEVKQGGAATNLRELYMACEENDKNLIVYSLLSLQLIKGKTLMFVASTERAYALQLFLEKFRIPAAVLNADMPLASRLNVLEQFNQSVFQLLIATDASSDSTAQAAADVLEEDSEGDDENDEEYDGSEEEEEDDDEDDDEEEEEEDNEDEDEDDSSEQEEDEEQSSNNEDDDSEDNEEEGEAEDDFFKTLKRKQEMIKSDASSGIKKERDAQYAANRGLDIEGVETVINVDMPLTYKSYTHRIGRTARGKNKGVALSLIATAEDRKLLHYTMEDRRKEARHQPEPLSVSVKALEVFRYRVDDVSRSITRKAVAALRARELQHEALHNDRLKSHFQQNSADLNALKKSARHLKDTNTQFRHLDSLPAYLLPATLRGENSAVQAVIQSQLGYDANLAPSKGGVRRTMASRDPLRNLAAKSSADTLRKRRKLVTTEYMLKKDAKLDYEETNPDALPPLARNKLWKIQHGKKIKKIDNYTANKRRYGHRKNKVGPGHKK